ncbi:TPA: hypothetical protein P0E36_004876 [Vibrio harveyi]|nr:hypothetical protein [Vibrio harveyi]
MQFHEINGQVIMPVFSFTKGLSMTALGVYASLCARTDLNVHADQEIAEQLGMELAEWFSAKVELVEAKLITSSPITEDFDEEEYEKHLQKVREEISQS